MKVLTFGAAVSFHIALLLQSLHSTEGNNCRVLGFYPQLYGKRLRNHIIQKMKSGSEDSCQALCYMDVNCRSINFRQTKDSDGTHICELNDVEDKQHPDDLKNEHSFSYRGTKTPCTSNPCHTNAICQTGFGSDGYRCVCPAGYRGISCETDIDECDKSNPCHVNAKCTNTPGSYLCNCSIGYQGNGSQCEDIDECDKPNPCHVSANCTNTPGSYICNCSVGYQGNGIQCEVMMSCQDILRNGLTQNGVYTIRPDNQGPLNVYCDQNTDGGGWTVLQRRASPFNTSFNRSWEEYRIGFGNLTGEFWLGNDNIHRLTLVPTSFRIDFNSVNKLHATYESFTVAGAADRYRWNMNSYSGSLLNAIYGSRIDNIREEGMQFSAPDNDNDGCQCHCAMDSGWWLNHCGLVNLNAVQGPFWAQALLWPHDFMQATFSEMKVRP